MGSRMIKKWIMRPLVKHTAIAQRQDALELFYANTIALQTIEAVLAQLPDLERVIGRIALKRAHIQDYAYLKQGLGLLPVLRDTLAMTSNSMLLKAIADSIDGFESLHQMLQAALHDELGSELMVKSGFDQELDCYGKWRGKGHKKF